MLTKNGCIEKLAQKIGNYLSQEAISNQLDAHNLCTVPILLICTKKTKNHRKNFRCRTVDYNQDSSTDSLS